MTCTEPVESPEERWIRQVERYLPLGMLGLATLIAFVSAPALGLAAPWRLAAQAALVLGLAAWLALRLGRPPTRALYVVRTAAALVLTALNPLFCIFAWVGYTDADEVFTRRPMWAAIGVTAVVMALGQSGGVPASWEQALLLLLLLVVNFGVAYAVGRMVIHQNQVSAARQATIEELERVNASLEQALAENARLHETVVAQARDAGVQEERQRLAREIHDTIAQALAGILAQLQAAQEGTDLATVRRRVDRSAALARDALAEARRSVMDLVPAPLENTSLPDAVESGVRAWAALHPVHAETVVTGTERPLHPEVEATVLRVVQEALSNVAKHAGATRVGVTLSYLDDEVLVDVRDDGAGFDPSLPVAEGSFGLRGMRQRAERLAGALDVEAEPGSGTAVSVRLPALERATA